MSEVTTDNVEHYRDEYKRLEGRLPGRDWLTGARRQALDAFVRSGFPGTRQEDWKYTDLRPIAKRNFQSADTNSAITDDQLAPFLPEGLDEVHRLVFVDGHYVSALSSVGQLPEGVELGALSAALESPDDGLRETLGSPINGYATPFTDLNTAFLTDGLHLRLADNAVLEAPVHLMVVSSGETENRMSHLRHVLRLGANSQATLIEHSIGLGEAPYFCNAVTESHAGPGANLTRTRVQQESERGYHVSSFHAHQARDSVILNHGVDLGGRLVRADTNSWLGAEGASISLFGVYLPTGRQHIDNHTRVDHAHPHGTSREAYKGILDGRARGVFNGKVYVHRNAQKTDSEQSSDALVLSEKAEVDAKPELEIYADDVKCAHGSTVGQLDENAVFYLRSRGIDLEGARAILTYSFADELLQGITVPALRDYVESAFLTKMPEGARFSGLL